MPVKVQLTIYPAGDEHAITVHESELANLRGQGLIRTDDKGGELVTEVTAEPAKPAPPDSGAKPAATTPPAGAVPKEKP